MSHHISSAKVPYVVVWLCWQQPHESYHRRWTIQKNNLAICPINNTNIWLMIFNGRLWSKNVDQSHLRCSYHDNWLWYPIGYIMVENKVRLQLQNIFNHWMTRMFSPNLIFCLNWLWLKNRVPSDQQNRSYWIEQHITFWNQKFGIVAIFLLPSIFVQWSAWVGLFYNCCAPKLVFVSTWSWWVFSWLMIIKHARSETTTCRFW